MASKVWKPCLVCNALDLEMISIFRHPKNLNFILNVLLELQAQEDDYLCKECCNEVINTFDFKRNLPQPELPSTEVLTDLVTIKSESEEIIDSEIDYKFFVETDEATDLGCEDLPADNKLELKAQLETRSNGRGTPEVQKSIEYAASDGSDATRQQETASSSNAYASEVNIEPKSEVEWDTDSSQSDSEGFQEFFKKEKSVEVDIDDNVESEPVGRTKDGVRAIKENASTQKEFVNRWKASEVNVKWKHVCFECGLTFEWKHQLAIHTQTHAKKSYQCQYCCKIFLLKAPFEVHVRTHTKPYKCSDCKKRYTSLKALQSHKSANATERSLVCPHCSEAFNRSCAFRQHILRTHAQEKQCVCFVCTKSFLNSRTLQTHVRTHALDKLYVCSVCGRYFSDLAQLKHHEGTHIGQGSHKCVHCSYIFPTEAAYLRHLQTHATGTFLCSHCPQWFDNKVSLIVHYIDMHTQKRPYECPYCSKTFSFTTGIHRHLQVVHCKQTLKPKVEK